VIFGDNLDLELIALLTADLEKAAGF